MSNNVPLKGETTDPSFKSFMCGLIAFSLSVIYNLPLNKPKDTKTDDVIFVLLWFPFILVNIVLAIAAIRYGAKGLSTDRKILGAIGLLLGLLAWFLWPAINTYRNPM